MTPSVVIGVGNDMRGDDGVGPAVARAVTVAGAIGVAGGRLRVVQSDGETGRLLDAWAGAPLAVVVDAVVSGAPAGTVHRLGPDELTAPGHGGAGRASTHALGLADAWAVGRSSGLVPGRLAVVGVEASGFEMGSGLSAPVAAAVPRAVAAVAALVGGDYWRLGDFFDGVGAALAT